MTTDLVHAWQIQWNIGGMPMPKPQPNRRCTCCKEPYVRGHWTCCAPPKNMSSESWFALHCPMPADGGCGKCWRHCECPNKADRAPKGPMADLAAEFLARLKK